MQQIHLANMLGRSGSLSGGSAVERQIDENFHKLATSNTKHRKLWFIKVIPKFIYVHELRNCHQRILNYHATGKPDNTVYKIHTVLITPVALKPVSMEVEDILK